MPTVLAQEKTGSSGKKAANPLEARLGYLLRRAAIAAMNALSEQLEQVGLRRVEVSVLALIAANPGITASRIGRMLEIRGANMVPLTRALEEGGLIERKPIDGKSHGLYLTAAGRDIQARTAAILDAFELELEADLTSEQRALIEPALRAIWQAGERLSKTR